MNEESGCTLAVQKCYKEYPKVSVSWKVKFLLTPLYSSFRCILSVPADVKVERVVKWVFLNTLVKFLVLTLLAMNIILLAPSFFEVGNGILEKVILFFLFLVNDF